jgi:mevalonate kinase
MASSDSSCRRVAVAASTLLTASLPRSHPGEGGGAGSSAVELDLRDSGLTFSWPCSRLRGALGEEISANPGAPAPCSPDQLAAIARLLQDQDIPEAKIWLSAGLSAFLFLYTSILGLVSSSTQINQSCIVCDA